MFGSPFAIGRTRLQGAVRFMRVLLWQTRVRRLAAADGVVLSAEYHHEYGNLLVKSIMVKLITRYALSEMAISAGTLVRRGESLGKEKLVRLDVQPDLTYILR